jgi:hypothetical protein
MSFIYNVFALEIVKCKLRTQMQEVVFSLCFLHCRAHAASCHTRINVRVHADTAVWYVGFGVRVHADTAVVCWVWNSIFYFNSSIIAKLMFVILIGAC